MRILKNNKDVGGLQTFILSVVAVSVTLVVGLIVLSSVQTSNMTTGTTGIANTTHYCAGSAGAWNGTNCTSGTLTLLPTDYTATGAIIGKLDDIPTWIGIIIVVALAFIVLSYFYTQR